jgi:colicin import membrane protein
MNTSSVKAPHLEFAPPPAPGSGRAMFLALMVHALLLLALTWGIHWQDQPQDMSVEAELWSSIPQPVAAKGNAPETLEEVVQPTPKPTPPQPPTPEKKVEPSKPEIDPQIAIDKQKKKEAQDKAREEAKAKRDAKLQEVKDKKAEKAKELEKRKAEELQRAEERHLEEVKRLRGLADATGASTDMGKAIKAAGPSASYLGRLRARIKPNITFSDAQLQTVSGNPAAEVVVFCSPSGQIIGSKLKVKSGNEAWDQAVLNAVEKTGSLPRDENGNMPSEITFSFRPRD